MSRSGRGSPDTPSGTRTARGAVSAPRTPAASQRRKYGVNTAKWSLPPDGTTRPGASAVTTASWTRSSHPVPARASRSRSSRRAAYRLNPAATCAEAAPVSSATRLTTAAASPRRTTSRPPRWRSPASRAARQSARKASRLGASNPARWTASSRTNNGTTSSASRRAARSTGLSCRRRSEVNSITATLMERALLAWFVGEGSGERSGEGSYWSGQAVGKSISATGDEVGSSEPPVGSTVMPIPDARSTGPFSRTASSLAFGSIRPAERIVPSSLNQSW